MKNVSIIMCSICLSATMLLTSCDLNVRTDKYRSSAHWGEVTEEKLDLDKFTSIVVNTTVDVVFTQGDNQSVKVEGNERAISEYDFRVEGSDDDSEGTLYIDNARSLNYNLPSVRLKITAPDLKSITINGSADFNMKDSVSLEKLDVIINGSGDCDIRNLNTSGNTMLSVFGSGDIVVRNLTAPTIGAAVTGSGDIENRQAMCEGEANLFTSGSGDIDATIVGRSVNATSQGSGDIDLDVFCDSLTISSQGTGDIEVKGSTAVLFKDSEMLGTTTTKKLKAETVEYK